MYPSAMPADTAGAHSTLRIESLPGHPDFRPLASLSGIRVDLRYASPDNFLGEDLYAPFDCAALLYRDPAFARVVHTQDASYLDVIHEENGWNPSDYAYQLTRRARGLPLWFSLAVNGTDAYRDAIERVLATARGAAARIRGLPHLELVREPELSVVLFRRSGWRAADYDAWSARLLAEQIAFVTPSRWHGEPVARLAFLHPETTLEIVDEVLATL